MSPGSLLPSRPGQLLPSAEAVPINVVKDILGDLQESGHAIRGYLGAVVRNIEEEDMLGLGVHPGQGAVVDSLDSVGPAQEGRPPAAGRHPQRERTARAHCHRRHPLRVRLPTGVDRPRYRPPERKRIRHLCARRAVHGRTRQYLPPPIGRLPPRTRHPRATVAPRESMTDRGVFGSPSASLRAAVLAAHP